MSDNPDLVECVGPAGAGPSGAPGAPADRRRVRVAAAADVEDATAEQVDADGTKIALVRIGDAFHAIGDRCSHANYSLSEGELDTEECTLECWKHGALFDLSTGEPLTLPATQPVPVYDVEVADGEVYVLLPTNQTEKDDD